MLLSVFGFAAPAMAQFNVVSVSPELHSTSAMLNESVTVTFSTDVDEATLTENSFRVFGSQSGQLPGVYSASGMVATFEPALTFKPGEIISVVLTSQIQGIGGGMLTNGYHWEFAVRPEYGAGEFALPPGSNSPTTSVLYPTNTLQNPTSIYAGDLTGDTYLELAIANSSSPSVTIMLNSRSGSINVDNLYTQELVVGLEDNPLDITGGDLNGDGQLDLVVSHYTVSSISVLLNQTNGGSLPSMQPQVIQTTERPFSSVVADLNGDGWQDIAVAGFGSDEVAVHLNSGNGVFPSFQTYPVGLAASDIVARDMTNDGFVDLIVASTGDQRIDILVNDQSGAFTLAQSIPLDYTPASISAFDFQEADGGTFGDSWADIFVTAQDTALVTVLEHLGDPVLLNFVREDVSIPLISQAFGHVLADMDVMDDGGLGPDADLDAVLTQFSTNEVRLLLNQAAGPFIDGQQFGGSNVGDTPLGITAGDFERDGDVDVAFVSATGNEVRVLFNADSRLSDFELIGELPDFGDVYTCQDSTIEVSFLNRRFTTVTVLDIVADPSPPFSVNLPAVPFDVPARDTLTVEVTFAPDLPVPYTGLLVITSNDGFETSLTEVELVGQGIESDLTAVPDTVNFGQVIVGETIGQGVNLINAGNVAVVVDSLDVSDPVNFSADFAGATTITVGEGGASEVLNTSFMPQSLGSFSATVTLFLNDPCDSTLVVTLIGEGVDPMPDLIASDLIVIPPDIEVGDDVIFEGVLSVENMLVDAPSNIEFEVDGVIFEQDIALPTISVGQQVQFQTLPFVPDRPGVFSVTFRVDADNEILELDESNNEITVEFEVSRGELVVTPNPFTPNNDGMNEEVQIDFERLVLDDPKLLIYSFDGRLIREITESEGTSMMWDGRDSNDRTRDPGVYLFVLMEGEDVVESGHVTLAR